MSQVADRLLSAGFELPDAPAPAGMYVPAVRVGDLVYTAGQLPLQGGSLMAYGRLGDSIDAETGRACAGRAALNALAAASTVCDLDDIVCVVKLVCYVSSSEAFTAQPAVADGASEVLVAAFGEAGRHAREAVGVSALPLGSPVEVSVILQTR